MNLKIDKVILILLIIGALFTILAYFGGNSCGSACDNHSFLNPFGIGETPESCITLCVYTPNPYFYILFDMTVILAIVYCLIIVVRKKN
ncbi:MAG: hypothetical protein PHU63_01995 [Candidatus ainarchaeum sp.]|nr:hypothetical protein [Candidatus ainarchaeum sp.]